MIEIRTFAAVSALTLALAGAAIAQPRDWETPVSYADLRIEREADARTLLQRISRVATRLCGGPEISLRAKQAMQACRAEAVARAVEQVDAPMLTAVHSGDARRVQLARR